MTEELYVAIIGLIITAAGAAGFWLKIKRRFSKIVDLLSTLDKAWSDDKVTETEWNEIWTKLMIIIRPFGHKKGSA